MSVSRKHMYCLYLLARHLELQNFGGADSALLDKSVSANNNEKLPLGIVPMLTLGNTRPSLWEDMISR